MVTHHKIRLIVYTLCFFSFCVIDWIMGTQNGHLQMVAANTVGIVISVIYLASVELNEFRNKKYFYIISLVITLTVVAMAVVNFIGKEINGQLITVVINVDIYCVLFVHLLDRIRTGVAFKLVNKITAIVGAVVWMMIISSRYDGKWPLLYTVMLLFFLSVCPDKATLVTLAKGAVAGVVLGGIFLQSLAFAFRPYDDVRYSGFHINPNFNGLLYACSSMAFLIAAYYFFQKKQRVYALIMSAMTCFWGGLVVLTESRSALLTFGFVVFVYLLVTCANSIHWFSSFVKKGFAFFVAVVMFIPIAYFTVRYTPALLHHPIWFEGEYAEWRVHSFDPIDSDKYVSFNEAMSESVGRYLFFAEDLKDKVVDFLLPPISAHAADAEHPLYEGEIGDFEVRSSIRNYYLQHTNLRGHLVNEGGVWLTSEYCAPHAHNLFAQFLFCFGLFAFVPFVLYLILLIGHIVKYVKKCNWNAVLIVGLPAIVFFVFGFWEIDWRAGQLSFVLFLLSQYGVINNIDFDSSKDIPKGE